MEEKLKKEALVDSLFIGSITNINLREFSFTLVSKRIEEMINNSSDENKIRVLHNFYWYCKFYCCELSNLYAVGESILTVIKNKMKDCKKLSLRSFYRLMIFTLRKIYIDLDDESKIYLLKGKDFENSKDKFFSSAKLIYERFYDELPPLMTSDEKSLKLINFLSVVLTDKTSDPGGCYFDTLLPTKSNAYVIYNRLVGLYKVYPLYVQMCCIKVAHLLPDDCEWEKKVFETIYIKCSRVYHSRFHSKPEPLQEEQCISLF